MKRLFLLTSLLMGLGTTSAHAERAITVFAAASLGGVLEEIAEDFNTDVAFSFAGSGTLARQVASGAPADVVVLASPVWMTWLETRGAVDPQTTRVIAGNTLVLIAGPSAQIGDAIGSLSQWMGDEGRLAMGHRDAVPAGVFAQQWLRASGQWEHFKDRLAETDNVRAALALVATGAAPVGIVYATDAVAERRVYAAYAIPADTHDPIQYPAAALTPQGSAFLHHLTTAKAAKTFADHGFQKATP